MSSCECQNNCMYDGNDDNCRDQIRYNEKGEPVISVCGLINYTVFFSTVVGMVVLGGIEVVKFYW